MNIKKLNEAEKHFLERYPAGFENPEMIEMARKHKPEKMLQMAREAFSRENFAKTNDIINSMVKIISRSSMVSLFEKPKFRDFAYSLAAGDQIKLSTGLEKFLFDDQETGFNMMLEVLKKGKLAKWSLITICPFYFNPQTEVFIKPTTVKNAISFFELSDLNYKPVPYFDFYENYRDTFNEMKKYVSRSLSPDNGHFSGFLMIAMENLM